MSKRDKGKDAGEEGGTASSTYGQSKGLMDMGVLGRDSQRRKNEHLVEYSRCI